MASHWAQCLKQRRKVDLKDLIRELRSLVLLLIKSNVVMNMLNYLVIGLQLV